MLKRLTVVIMLSGMSLAAQVTATLENIPGTNPADAFDISGMASYNHDVVYKSDLYVAYWHGAGPTMKDDYATWTWNPVICTGFASPPPGSSPECNDRVMMAWKHFSCADPNWACGSNAFWNMYNGSKNYHTNPSVTAGNGNTNYFTWQNSGGAIAPPPIRRMAGWSDISGFGYIPASCQGSDGQSHTLSSYSGSGYPSVIYANGKWFMAYDANLHSPASGGATEEDVHRIAWATSTDGANWIHHGIIMRDASEAYCADGLYTSDLYFENNTFYLLVTSITHGVGPGTNKMYLLKAPYSSTSTTGFTGWYAPTGKDFANNLIYPSTPNVSPATPIDFRFLQSITDDSDFIINGTIAKVYASAASSNYRYVLVVDLSPALSSSGGQKICPPQSDSYPLRVYTSAGLEKFFTSKSDITASNNFSRFQSAGWYGWSPDIPFLVPDGSYSKVYDPVTMFVNYCASSSNRLNIGRVRLNLTGDIYN